MTPYYRSDDGAITVYHARWEDVLAAGLVPMREVALIHADPPYSGGILAVKEKLSKNDARAHRTRVWEPIAGDNVEPFDPAALLALGRPTVLWGANHYAPRVPGSPSWILWDKRRDVTPDNQADGELAWTNLGGPLRIFRHLWRGFARESERELPLHPTQKPIALCSWVYQRAKLKRGDLVLVPYLGSGPDLPAALAMGLRVMACDVEEWCCRTAVGARLNAAPHPEPAAALGPLFGREVSGMRTATELEAKSDG